MKKEDYYKLLENEKVYLSWQENNITRKEHKSLKEYLGVFKRKHGKSYVLKLDPYVKFWIYKYSAEDNIPSYKYILKATVKDKFVDGDIYIDTENQVDSSYQGKLSDYFKNIEDMKKRNSDKVIYEAAYEALKAFCRWG